MSTRRLAQITTVPMPIKKAFRDASPTVSCEERLWRERAARMTLDALGYTNLTVKPHEHNTTVRYARRWFRFGLLDDSAEATFDAAEVRVAPVRAAVLDEDPILFELSEYED